MKSLVEQYDYSFVTATPIDLVLTVPPVWSDGAKDATRRAAKQAGLGERLHLISEPEAAAVYAIKALQKTGLQAGTNIIVCDAGGGTVDLISYRIKSLEPPSVEESGVGTGSLCGAAFLNYKFEDYVRTIVLGEENFEVMLKHKPKAWQAALNNFETYVKRNLDEDNPKEFCIPFPGFVNDAIEDGYLTMTTEEVRDIIFDQIIHNVITLVQDQVSTIRANQETISAILLVGDFGQSKYLLSKLKAHFSINLESELSVNTSSSLASLRSLPFGKSREDISILRPTHAWTTVARGAAIRGLQGTIVTERRSRKHYGVAASTLFDQRRHPEYSKYWDRLDEVFRARGNMTWFVSKDERVSENRAITYQYQNRLENGTGYINQIQLYESGDEIAPTMKNPTLQIVCTVTVDFNNTPSHLFVHKVNSKGFQYRALDYDLEMVIDSAGIKFSSKIDGATYGIVTADFDC